MRRAMRGAWAVEHFRAMGTDCRVEVRGVDGATARALASDAQQHVARLERRWSRFRPDSDVSRINAAAGAAVRVDASTLALLRFAVSAHEATHGAFDPLLADAMCAHGYDVDFSALTPATVASSLAHPATSHTALAQRAATVTHTPDTPHPGRHATCTVGTSLLLRDAEAPAVSAAPPPWQRDQRAAVATAGLAASTRVGVDIDDTDGTVRRCSGALDLGGVAKGYAADLVAAGLVAAGATAALVDLGGDLACRDASGATTDQGARPPAGWSVSAEHPCDPRRAIATIELWAGGVATSSVMRRRWTRADGSTAHHLLDPRTGRPLDGDVLACSVAADTCAHAEVLTKAVLCGGSGALDHVVEAFVPDVVAVLADGSVRCHGRWRCP